MTTLVGIEAAKGTPGIVLAADLSGTRESWEAQGDVAFRRQTKEETQKINVDDKRRLAIAMTGIVDPGYGKFLYDILEGKTDFRQAIKKGSFEPLLNLNISRSGGDYYPKQQNSMLIAERLDKRRAPRLWSCRPMGRIVEAFYLAIGSGGEYADKYLSKQGLLDPRQVSLEEGVDLALNALEEAATDIYTGGTDLVVVTRDGIQEYGGVIQKDLREAREKSRGYILDQVKELGTKKE
jgi:hypothetical protein